MDIKQLFTNSDRFLYEGNIHDFGKGLSAHEAFKFDLIKEAPPQLTLEQPPRQPVTFNIDPADLTLEQQLRLGIPAILDPE